MNPNFTGLRSPAVSGGGLPFLATVFSDELNMDAITWGNKASSYSFERFEIWGP
jgi:hypothetical protein